MPNELYTPPLETADSPFFVEGRNDSGSTWAFAGEELPEPEWMGSGPCEHTDISPSASDLSALEHSVRLSALAEKWSIPSVPSSPAMGPHAPSGLGASLAAFGRRGPRWI